SFSQRAALRESEGQPLYNCNYRSKIFFKLLCLDSRQIVFDKFQRRFQLHDYLYQHLFGRLERDRKFAFQLTSSLRRSCVGLRVDQIADCLSLTEIHLSVFASTQGELSWFGEPGSKVLSQIQHSSENHRRAVATQLDHFFTRKRARLFEVSYQRRIQRLARVSNDLL